MSDDVLQPALVTERFKAFRFVCADEPGGTVVELEHPTFAMALRGAFTLFVDDREVHVEPSQIVLARPGSPIRSEHFGCEAEDCAMLVAVEERSDLGRWMTRSMRQPVTRFSVPPEWMVRFRYLFNRSPDLSDQAAEAMAGSFAEKFGGFLRSSEPSPRGSKLPPSWDLVETVRRELAHHFDQSLTLDMLAEEMGISKFHLARTFREVTGYPVHRYQTLLRMEAALSRLRNGGDDLTDLALALGFSSHSHFTSVFHRHMGMTPSAARSVLSALDGPGGEIQNTPGSRPGVAPSPG